MDATGGPGSLRQWPPGFASRWTGPFLAVCFALLCFRLFRMIDLYAVNVFYWDQWDLIEALTAEFFAGKGAERQ